MGGGTKDGGRHLPPHAYTWHTLPQLAATACMGLLHTHTQTHKHDRLGHTHTHTHQAHLLQKSASEVDSQGLSKGGTTSRSARLVSSAAGPFMMKLIKLHRARPVRSSRSTERATHTRSRGMPHEAREFAACTQAWRLTAGCCMCGRAQRRRTPYVTCLGKEPPQLRWSAPGCDTDTASARPHCVSV